MLTTSTQPIGSTPLLGVMSVTLLIVIGFFITYPGRADARALVEVSGLVTPTTNATAAPGLPFAGPNPQLGKAGITPLFDGAGHRPILATTAVATAAMAVGGILLAGVGVVLVRASAAHEDDVEVW